MPDCCIIPGKPDDRVNHIDYAMTLFVFTWPADKAQTARTLASQPRLATLPTKVGNLANYFGFHGAHLQMPSFMRGKWQLSSKEVVMSKRTS